MAEMKYIVVLGDGMADDKQHVPGGYTPLESAKTPFFDKIAPMSLGGMAKTVPDGCAPGSDAANLSVLGYNPLKYLTGRSPIEAYGIGLKMAEDQLSLRANLVTLSGEGGLDTLTMADYSAGDISDEESAMLLADLARELDRHDFTLHHGFCYRHIVLWNGGKLCEGRALVPPHDITARPVTEYLPKNEFLRSVMEKSRRILAAHPVNKAREAKGLLPANCLWFWGEGSRPALPSFKEKYGLSGAMVSAVDLLKGIAALSEMKVIKVPGATGLVNTNYEGKVAMGTEALENGCDFLYLHLEAPDECGHRYECEGKVKAVELVDKVASMLAANMEKLGYAYKMLIMPDHPTPLHIRTHTSDPVPFIIYDPAAAFSGPVRFTETECAKTGVYEPEGDKLMAMFLGVNS